MLLLPITATQMDVLNSVKRLKEPSATVIARYTGLCVFTVKSVCRELVRNGYLEIRRGNRYSATKKQLTDLPEDSNFQKIDKSMVKEIADHVVEEISNQIKSLKIRGLGEEEVKIKTDFVPHIEDETLQLESNIGKLGNEFENEKSNIDQSVNLLKNIKKYLYYK